MKYEKLISIRKLKGFTQEKLAEKIAMQQTTLSRKERGLSPISDEEWERMAWALQTPVDQIRDVHHLNINISKDYIIPKADSKQYVTIPAEVLERILQIKDSQITSLIDLLKKK